ncbi:SDR family NAD(P)-dependent oxidoreductase [Hyphomonas sp.]|uniref:SDR family NAD(P)-dependent oxidoreductase n=1 Tax=Hyphomonas sp. TaxID=87 RepID=UPI0039187E67
MVQTPTGNANLTLITEGLADAPLAERHWAALLAARAAKRPGATLVFLQSARSASGLEGLARTLRIEWPDVRSVCFTLPSDDPASAAHLLPWLKSAQTDLWFDASYSASRPLLRTSPPAQNMPPADPGAVWLVTGGARGVTAACAIELARLAGGTFLLAGRSSLAPWPEGIAETADLKSLRGALALAARARGEKPAPAAIDKAARATLAGLEIRTTLAGIHETGAAAHYIPMDTADAGSVVAAINQIGSTFGAITGLIHGAGIIADRLADEKTEDELKRVFAPKADGLFNLLHALNGRPLKHLALFSSASAFFGNRGQADYAMANAILANTGRDIAASQPGVRVKVFDWGPWEGGMVDATLAEHFRAQGVPLIPLEDGARIFARELLGGAFEDIELVVGTMEGEA